MQGNSKIAKRKCYGYGTDADGNLQINTEEADTVRLIFTRYASGSSLGKIAEELYYRGINSPTGKAKWSRETIHKLLSNEKYVGSVILQKTICMEGTQVKNLCTADQYCYENQHPAIISENLFHSAQTRKRSA